MTSRLHGRPGAGRGRTAQGQARGHALDEPRHAGRVRRDAGGRARRDRRQRDHRRRRHRRHRLRADASRRRRSARTSPRRSSSASSTTRSRRSCRLARRRGPSHRREGTLGRGAAPGRTRAGRAAGGGAVGRLRVLPTEVEPPLHLRSRKCAVAAEPRSARTSALSGIFTRVRRSGAPPGIASARKAPAAFAPSARSALRADAAAPCSRVVPKARLRRDDRGRRTEGFNLCRKHSSKK